MTDINVGAITEALNDKMDRNANNIESPKLPIFLVAVQYPTAENNYTWYRKYSDGWVEQGGLVPIGSSVFQTGTTINLPVTMADTNYLVFWTNGYNTYVDHDTTVTNRTTTTFTTGNYTSYQANANWKVEGMSAS